MTRRGKAENLGHALGGLMRRLDRKNPGAYLQVRVGQVWAEIAGPNVAQHTADTHIRGRELVVYVDSPVWATELSALSEQYRLRVNEALGQNAVSSVRFSVSRKVGERRLAEKVEGEAEEAAGKTRPPSVPLSEQERAQVEASVSAIEDEGLREAVLRATIADLEWKKGESEARGREVPRDGL